MRQANQEFLATARCAHRTLANKVCSLKFAHALSDAHLTLTVRLTQTPTPETNFGYGPWLPS